MLMWQMMDSLTKPLARFLHANHLQRLGIRNTMAIARFYNRLKYGRLQACRQQWYEERFDELASENGRPTGPATIMQDGWALDTSGQLPFLSQLLDAGEEIIKERAIRPTKAAGAYRSFFQNILVPEDTERFPAITHFGLSSELLTTVSRELGSIPVLSSTLPPGIRLAESTLDSSQNDYRDSQLFHIDYYSRPMVYVIVLLRDVTSESGPFCWISESESKRAARALGYWSRGKPYRISDEEFYSVVDRQHVHPLTYPKGTVLFINPSRCFHFGSRDAVIPRYQMMYGFSTACRTDLSEVIMKPIRYGIRPSDSRLRKLVLCKEYKLSA